MLCFFAIAAQLAVERSTIKSCTNLSFVPAAIRAWAWTHCAHCCRGRPRPLRHCDERKQREEASKTARRCGASSLIIATLPYNISWRYNNSSLKGRRAASSSTEALDTLDMYECGTPNTRLRHRAWNPFSRCRSPFRSHNDSSPYISLGWIQASYIFSFLSRVMLACFHTLSSFRKVAQASPILRETSDRGDPSAESSPPRYTALCFSGTGSPLGPWIRPLWRTRKRSVFPQWSSRPYCEPN